MDTTTSTNKEKEVTLWEENEYTTLPKSNVLPSTSGECDIITATKGLRGNEHLIDIIRKRTLTTDTSGIYKITNKINGNYYIGKSTKIGRRWCEHRRFLKQNRHDTPHLQNARNKYGRDNFKFEIIEREIPINELKPTEQKYLDIAKLEKDKCYNTNFISDGGMIGELHPNYKSIPINILDESKDIWLYRPYLEFVNYMNSKKYGPIVQQRVIKNFQSDTTLIKIKDETYRKNMSISTLGIRNGNWGNHQSEATKEKVRLRRKEYKVTDETRSNMAMAGWDKTIYKFENRTTEETFIGIKHDFYTKYKLNPSSISAIIYGKLPHHKQWIFLGEVK